MELILLILETKPGENIISFVDGVIDSSRYFVVRIKDPNSTRTTLVGIGFRDREIAFDFKTILNEYIKYIDRMDLASKMQSASLEDDGEESGGEHTTKVSLLVCLFAVYGRFVVCSNDVIILIFNE